MEKEPKDSWIDKVMESTAGMQKAVPADGLFHKIEQKLSDTVVYARTVPLRTVSMAAASIILLVVANVYILGNTANDTNVIEKSPVESVVEYYGLNENGINF